MEKANKPSKRWWFITYNNPPADWKAALEALGSQWAIGQLEQGQNGTPHIQGVLWFKEKLKNTYWKGRNCWAKPLSTDDVESSVRYCTKEESRLEGPHQVGNDPRRSSGHVQRIRRNFTEALEVLKQGRLKEVEPDILIPYFGNCQKVQALFTTGLSTDTPRGIWVYGAPGYGKSYYVRERFTDLYSKPQNKWWDGYTGQAHVLLDDLDKHGACLSHLLKIWLDQYCFEGEIKGGLVKPRYSNFIITSNYLPSELWDDPHTIEAISRRCIFIHFYGARLLVEGTDYGVLPVIPAQAAEVNWDYILSEFVDRNNQY